MSPKTALKFAPNGTTTPSSKRKVFKMLPPQPFFLTLESLLQQELAAETAEASMLLNSTPPTVLARAGLAVLNLNVASMRTGMGGRTVLELSLDPAVISKGSNGELPEHAIRTGDIVRLGPRPSDGVKKKERSETEAKGVEGVVLSVRERSLQVALGKEGAKDKDDVDVPDGKLWLVKLANDVTFRRMDQTLRRMLEMPEEGYSTLQRVLLGLEDPVIVDVESVTDVKFLNENLNDSQKEAIRFALAAPELALIHGPPGTGKTYTLIELILQFLKQGLKVLVCGPSNISVDNIVERLAQTSPETEIVRLGHPARLLPSVLNHSLEVLTKTSEAAGIVNDVRNEIDDKLKGIKKTKSGRERKQIYQDVKELRKEFREREGKAVDGLIRSSKVVLATLHGSGGRQTKDQEFDVLIVDEAGQAIEPQCWVPIVMAGKAIEKVVLAGDHLQLPPTVKGGESKDKEAQKKRVKELEGELEKLSIGEGEVKKAKSYTLEMTMFERLMDLYGEKRKRMLEVQYRMNTSIMSFPSAELYEKRLTAADSVKNRLLKDIEGVGETDDTREAVVFYDTQGGDFPEKTEEEEVDGKVKKSTLLGDSKSNEMEALVVRMHVQKLIEAGVKDEHIAVITPYNAQLAILSGMLREEHPHMEMGSVDGFQGREKETVIVSLVRSNAEREVGFLAEKRRLNVAMTRPKRHLCVVGDSETVSKGSAFLKRWMGWLEENADLRYPTIDELQVFVVVTVFLLNTRRYMCCVIDGEDRIVNVALLSLPFITVRIVYGWLGSFMPAPSIFGLMNDDTAAVVARALMQIVEESIVSAMFLWAGATVASTPEVVRHARANALTRCRAWHERGRSTLAKMIQAEWAPARGV